MAVRIVAAALLVSTLAACSDDTATPPATTELAPVTDRTEPAVAAGPDRTTDATTVTAPSTANLPAVAEPATGPGLMVEVSGGSLPAAVVDGITSHGGELADPTLWAARYGETGLPTVEGPGVTLVAAKIDMVRAAGGWHRVDEVQWLLVDTGHDGLPGLLDAVAAAAGATGVATTENSTINSADCITNGYPAAPDPGVVWEISGCSYPRFPGMYAVGVTRNGTFADTGPEGVPNVEPSTGPVVVTLIGELTAVSVTFDSPTTVGSATTLKTAVTASFDPTVTAEEATAKLTGGPLSGWRTFPGEASAILAGVPGASWVIGAGSATFTGEGRLQP